MPLGDYWIDPVIRALAACLGVSNAKHEVAGAALQSAARRQQRAAYSLILPGWAVAAAPSAGPQPPTANRGRGCEKESPPSLRTTVSGIEDTVQYCTVGAGLGRTRTKLLLDGSLLAARLA
ncbi:hypothetical protein OIDMADRAFT_25106 [Oidiodendron maius Zn]|uniref:Uncharacterized protein n=1 Tax=Oidiodendron maius (strain Zn) TaxID=913774 RepID=A0A0C3HQ64_OIDMZ|nr:hypothetical protein OIDMADRAFT_25106 [Oidiodendron maius Zn]